MPEPKLGKLIAIHPTSPQFLQRAAIVAVLSFLFFLGTFILYLIFQSFLFFLLSTAFLVVEIFTLIGWWMQKRSAVHIYTNGVTYRKRVLKWGEIEHVSILEDGGLSVVPKEGGEIRVPASIHELGSIHVFIESRIR